MADSDVNAGESDRFERHLIAGGELLRQKRTSQARDEFKAALGLKPNDVRALALLGLACFRMADFEGALPIYQQLVELNRNDASYWLNLGLVHLKLNDPQSAIEELKRCRELDPSQSRAVSYLGLAYARSGDYAQAYLAFLQAGEAELSREMEQYLTAAQRARIQAMVSGSQSGATDRTAKQRRHGTDDVKELGDDDVEVLDEESGYLIESEEATGQSAAAAGRARSRESAQGRTPAGPGRSPGGTPGGAPGSAKDGAKGGFKDASGSRPVVMPSRDAVVQEEVARPGVISLAVEQAVPSSAAAAGATRVAVGHKPPMSLSEFATSRLIRPEDGDHTFETSAGGVLIIRVKGRVYSRTEGVNVTGGELTYEVASRRIRGSSTSEDFSSDGRQLFIVSGNGHLVAAPLGEHFSAVSLDDDILYLREDLVFAFEDQLRWENGHVPGSQSTIHMVQFRGRGEVAFRSKQPLLAIKLAPERVLYIDAQVLAGWLGRVVPRAVSPAGGGGQSALFVECTGEGVVLVEEEEGGAEGWSRAAVTGVREGRARSLAGNS